MGEADTTLYLLAGSDLDRRAYRCLLRDELHRELTCESGFAPVGIWDAMRRQPQLAIVVADRPAPDVRDALGMIQRLRKQTRTLIVSAVFEPTQVRSWASCPMDGYIVKDAGVQELSSAIAAIAAGRSYFSNGLREELGSTGGAPTARAVLTKRETELLPLLANGMTLREAAQVMTVSYKTADSYRTNLLRKLGIRDRVELARYAIRERIIDP